jgi:hypothetical protein
LILALDEKFDSRITTRAVSVKITMA